MTELELYKFCQEKEIRWHGDDLLLWVDPEDIGSFAELVGDGTFDDGGLEVTMVGGGTVCIKLNDICEWSGIEEENILAKEDEND